MYIALPANSSRVAELPGDALQGALHVTFALPFRTWSRQLSNSAESHDSACPGTEVLGREIKVRKPAKVLIYFCGSDSMAHALIVHVLEKLLTGQVPTPFDNCGQAAIIYFDYALDTALSAKFKAHRRSAHIDVPVAQGSQAERMILTSILLVADANECFLEQADDGCDYLIFGKSWKPQIPRQAFADPR